jgi:uncharacterized protein
MENIIKEVTGYVENYMSQFDASHDYAHVQRVLGLAKRIEALERVANPNIEYRSDVITLAALLHDVGDRKYVKPGEDGTIMVQKVLLQYGADAALAKDVQTIVNHVSYSHEIKDLAKVQRCLAQYPELGIVQDADRLDAIGAVGVARCFAYNSAAGYKLEDAIIHFQEKLENLEGMMKTGSGKEMAALRTARIKQFRGWWEEEVKVAEIDI